MKKRFLITGGTWVKTVVGSLLNNVSKIPPLMIRELSSIQISSKLESRVNSYWIEQPHERMVSESVGKSYFTSSYPLLHVPQFWFEGKTSIENALGDPENLRMDIHIIFGLILTLAPSLSATILKLVCMVHFHLKFSSWSYILARWPSPLPRVSQFWS